MSVWVGRWRSRCRVEGRRFSGSVEAKRDASPRSVHLRGRLAESGRGGLPALWRNAKEVLRERNLGAVTDAIRPGGTPGPARNPGTPRLHSAANADPPACRLNPRAALPDRRGIPDTPPAFRPDADPPACRLNPRTARPNPALWEASHPCNRRQPVPHRRQPLP